MIRLLWVPAIAALFYVIFADGGFPRVLAIVFGVLAIVILALAELDEHLDGHHGGTLKDGRRAQARRIDRLAKR